MQAVDAMSQAGGSAWRQLKTAQDQLQWQHEAAMRQVRGDLPREWCASLTAVGNVMAGQYVEVSCTTLWCVVGSCHMVSSRSSSNTCMATLLVLHALATLLSLQVRLAALHCVIECNSGSVAVISRLL